MSDSADGDTGPYRSYIKGKSERDAVVYFRQINKGIAALENAAVPFALFCGSNYTLKGKKKGIMKYGK